MNDDLGRKQNVDPNPALSDSMRHANGSASEEETFLSAAPDTPDDLDLLIRNAATLFKPDQPIDAFGQAEQSLLRIIDMKAIQRLSALAEDEEIATHPQTLGTLRLIECLGEGGMGRVYRAVNPRLGRTQAVKILHSHRLRNPEAVARFHQEIAAIGRLNHPNIVSAHHADEENGIPYLVMEYVDGASLSQVMRRLRQDGRQLSIGVAVDLITQAATGMKYAHQQGVLHRDLKPGNLLVDKQGLVRVSDLGLARIASSENVDDGSASFNELTTDGDVMGTLSFMAPEQLRDPRSIDGRADVYALGATLFYLLTGRTVFPSNSLNVVSRIAATLNDPIPSINDFRPDVPKGIARVLTRALAKRPDERIKSMDELIEALSPWRGGSTQEELWTDKKPVLKTSVAPLKPKVSSGWRPPIRLRILVALCGFGFMLIAGFLLKLELPGEGMLIIESSDPNVAVSVRQVDGLGTKELEVSRGLSEPVKLRAGTWEITVKGVDADEFQIMPDRVEIGRNAQTSVRLDRKANDLVLNATEGDTSRNPSADQRVAIDAPTRTEERSWMHGDLHRSRDGIVAQPTTIDDVFGWQARFLRPASGRLQLVEYAQVSHLDPQGELIAWTTSDHVIVAEGRTGRIRQVFVPSQSSLVGWHSVRFSPSGQQLALISQYGSNVEIRRRDGRLLSAWTNPNPGFPLLDWLENEAGILLISETRLAIVDLSGTVISKWDIEPGSAKIRRGEMSRSGSDNVLFLTDDGRLREWMPKDDVVRDVLVVDEWEPERTGDFIQHPDGSRILTAHSNSKPRTEMWDTNGKLLATIDSRLHYASWSPDGRFLVDSVRNIRDAQTLEVIKQLSLPSNDPLATSRLVPNWISDEEIVFLSQGTDEWRSEVGAVRRFHPVGRQLPVPEFPQPLGPLSATFHGDGSISAYYGASRTNASLVNWDKQGIAKELIEAVPGPPDVHAVSWNLHDGRMLVPYGFMTTAMLSSDGKAIRQFDEMKTNAPTWSPDGKRFTLNNIDEHCVQLSDAATQEPIWRSPSYARVSQPSWSPDGRWLAFDSSNETKTEHRIHVVDLNHPDHLVREFRVSDEHHFAYPLQFSPDSQWIATSRFLPASIQPSNELLVIRLSDMKEYRKAVSAAHRGCYIVWAEDSKSLFAAGHVSIGGDDSGLSYKHFPNIADAFFPSAFARPDHWLNFDFRGATLDNVVGETVKHIGTSMRPVAAHTNFGQSLLRHQDRLLWLGGMYRQPSPLASVNTIDLQRMEVDWTGIAFDDGTALSMNGAGALLQSPSDIDRYVVHSIDYPGGRSVAVTRDELHRRITATADDKALLWAIDLTALVEGDDGLAISCDPSKLETLPNISAVRALDFSNIREISDQELSMLTRFKSVKRVRLPATPITSLPRLSELKQLEKLDLSRTMIREADCLEDLDSLRELNLSETLVDSSSALVLSELQSLQTLDLSHTRFDRFGLLELRKLKSLQQLDLSGIDLEEADIQALREALPNCHVTAMPTSK